MNLDLRYVYDWQKERIQMHWDHPLRMKYRLDTILVENGYILPMRKCKDKGYFGVGGVLDANKKPVEFSWVRSGKNGIMFGGSYEFDEECEYIDKDVVYLGYIYNHWGHFIVDFSTRLYTFFENKDADFVFIVYDNQEYIMIEPIRRFMELLGMKSHQLHFINRLVEVKKILVPEQSYQTNVYYTQAYLNVFNHVAANIEIDPEKIAAHEKLYLSRSAFKKAQTTEIGMEFIDALYENAGFKKLYPEQLSLDEQIYYMRNCSQYAAISGTLHHNLIFTQGCDINVHVINKTSIINLMLFDTFKMIANYPLFLDFYAQKYQCTLGFGPFFLVNSQYYKKYLEDNKISIPNINELQGNVHKNVLRYLNNYNSSYIVGSLTIPSAGKSDDVYYFDANYTKDFLLNYEKHSNCANDPYNKFLTIDDLKTAWVNQSRALESCLSLDASEPLLLYSIHVSNLGWLPDSIQGYVTGFPLCGQTIEAIKIYDRMNIISVAYQVYYNDSGWCEQVCDGAVSGTTGKSLKINGLKLCLKDKCDIYEIQYRLFSDKWSDWASEGHGILSATGFSAFEARIRNRNITLAN